MATGKKISPPLNLPAQEQPELLDLLDQFATQLKLGAGASKSAANTAESYTAALVVFKKFIKNAYGRKHGVKAPYPVSMLDNDVLLAYYDWLVKTSPAHQQGKPIPSVNVDINAPVIPAPPTKPPHYAHATIKHYIAAVKRFLAWAVAQGHLPQFDLSKTKIKLQDGRGGGSKAYPHRKIDPNLAAIVVYYDNLPLSTPGDQTEGLAGWQVRRRQVALLRNRAILHVLYDTGLRVSELTSLNRDEIDRALKTTPLPEDVGIEVIGKGGKYRTIWITRDSLVRIKAYLEARNDPTSVLFTGNKKGTAITRQMVWKVVKDGAIAAGISDFTGPHAFRHWLARQLFNDEEDPVPIEDVQALLGHASPNTTRTIYAPHTSKSRLHKVLQRARKPPEETINRTNTDDKF